MNDFDKVVKMIVKDDNFIVTKRKKKNTLKVKHKSGNIYFAHRCSRHFKPLKDWYNKMK